MIEVEVIDRQNVVSFDTSRLMEAVRAVLSEAGIDDGAVSIAVVTEAEIHALNRRHLEHDYPTDVLSFLLEHSESRLEGEIIASAETAAAQAPQYQWTPGDELLLYVIHGALHLVGYDDQTCEGQREMRSREAAVLAQFGLAPRYDH